MEPSRSSKRRDTTGPRPDAPTMRPGTSITAAEFRQQVRRRFKPGDERDFVVLFVMFADGSTILLCAKQESTKQLCYDPCSPDEIAKDHPYAPECDVYDLDEHNEEAADLLSKFVSAPSWPRDSTRMTYCVAMVFAWQAA